MAAHVAALRPFPKDSPLKRRDAGRRQVRIGPRLETVERVAHEIRRCQILGDHHVPVAARNAAPEMQEPARDHQDDRAARSGKDLFLAGGEQRADLIVRDPEVAARGPVPQLPGHAFAHIRRQNGKRPRFGVDIRDEQEDLELPGVVEIAMVKLTGVEGFVGGKEEAVPSCDAAGIVNELRKASPDAPGYRAHLKPML